ncbi:MAG TPA: hypothetical protein ENI51_00960 [Candidatus Atribacteria bacterium]|nr:hypothetical protein [Candidatus Atribacteria bacterium]
MVMKTLGTGTYAKAALKVLLVLVLIIFVFYAFAERAENKYRLVDRDVSVNGGSTNIGLDQETKILISKTGEPILIRGNQTALVNTGFKKLENIKPFDKNIKPFDNISLVLTIEMPEKGGLKAPYSMDLVLSTELKNVDSYIEFDEKILTPKEEIVDRIPPLTKHTFSLPSAGIDKIYIHMSGQVPDIRGNLLFYHLVQRNYYLFDKQDFYISSMKHEVK